MARSGYGAFSSEVIKTIQLAETVGWEYIGVNGGGHPRLKHKSGSVVDIAGTTVNFNTIENDRHRLWRISGAPDSTRRAGKYRKGGQGSGFSLDQAVKEAKRNADLSGQYTTGDIKPKHHRPPRDFALGAVAVADAVKGLERVEEKLASARELSARAAEVLEARRAELEAAQTDYDEMALTWKVRDAERAAEGAVRELLRAQCAVDDQRAYVESIKEMST